MAWRVFLASCVAAASATGPSISSCGGPSDVLQNAQFVVSPDPIVKGRPFTITAMGTLARNLSTGTLKTDFDVKLLVMGHSIVDDRVQKSVPFSLEPGFPAGDVRFLIGPITLPGEVPGSADVTGRVVILDEQGASVACVALDLHFAVGSEALVPLETPLSICSQPDDHLRSLTVNTAGGVFEMAGTLDEGVSKMAFDAKLSVHLGLIHLPVQLEVPVEYTPGLRQGSLSAKFGPVKDESIGRGPNPAIQVTGQIVWKDGIQQEIACLSLGDSGTSPDAIAVLL